MSKRKQAEESTIDMADNGTGPDLVDSQAGGFTTPAGAPVESKADKFVRLVMKRMPKALAALKRVRMLAARGQYQWTPAAAAQIVDELSAEVVAIQVAFAGQPAAKSGWVLRS